MRKTHIRDLTELVSTLIQENLGSSLKDRWLAENLLSKFADPDPTRVRLREQAALSKWLATEERNQRTQMRLFEGAEANVSGVPLNRLLSRARKLIRSLIGSTPNLESLAGSFSTGASTSIRRETGGVLLKYAGQPDVTQEAWDVIWPWIYRDFDLWHTLNPEVLNPRFVDGNIMFTVPKNNEIDRIACKEPDLNIWAQKAIGDHIRRRLRRVGINLNDQTRNQRLAYEGSLDGCLATVDLSSASDSVTVQLVIELLPFEWSSILRSLACKRTRLLGGETHENEMLSSMGNGFTFELESLIFWAITQAVTDEFCPGGIVSVYGDDIICQTTIYKTLRNVLGYCGFMVNDKKSFSTGYFRESCGKHYHKGRDVTPFYIKRPIDSLPDLIRILNRLRAWCAKDGFCDAAWWNCWHKLANQVRDRRLFGGYDLDSTETVASYKGSGYRLIPITATFKKVTERHEKGRYLMWQSNASRQVTADHRSENPSGFTVDEPREILVTYVVPEKFRTVRPRKGYAFAFGLAAPVFPQELSLSDIG